MNECGRCHQFVPGKMHFIRGCEVHVCKECAHEAYEKCKCCGGYFAEEDIVYPEAGDPMCIWCVSKRYLICPHCREYVRKDEAVEFHDQLMCGNCRDAYFSHCDCCHESFETTELMDATDEDGKSVKVCPNCLREKFRRCVGCGSWGKYYCMNDYDGKAYCKDCCEICWNCIEATPRDKLETINATDGYHHVCPACYKLYDQCAFCGNEYLKERLHKIDDEWYCDACLSKYIAQLKGENAYEASILQRRYEASILQRRYEDYILQRRKSDDQWVLSIIASAIYRGDMTYGDWLAKYHPTPEEKKDVDKYLRAQFVENGEKNIPGFND